MLGRLAGLLAVGMWPGAVPSGAAGGTNPTKGVRFVVINDFHHENAECDLWMETLFRQVAKTEGTGFCFGLGDMANSGKRENLEMIARLAQLTNLPFYVTPGNHDLDLSPIDGHYSEIFPDQLNYTFTQNGWQFVVVDTSEGNKWKDVTIAPETLAWLDKTMPTLDPRAPLVLATHFPLASEVTFCPLNAEQLLGRFVGYNLRGTFSGHYHGRTAHTRGVVELVTNVCVARVRGNHDGTKDKGYFVCDGSPAGELTRNFVPFGGV